MSIKGLKLNDFTVFEKAEFKFSSGLNIILGENSTGKTHLMKLMYGIIRENDKRSTLSDVFKVDAGGLATLIRNRSKGPSEIKLELSGGFFEHSIQRTDPISADRLLPVKPLKGKIPLALFIPAVEKLSSYEGFMASYQMRELSYDVTHYDICMALSAGILKGEKADAAVKLLQPLTEAWGGTVSLENGRFYVALKNDEKYQVHQLSEGYRKLGSIVRLVNNGAIEKHITSDNISSTPKKIESRFMAGGAGDLIGAGDSFRSGFLCYIANNIDKFKDGSLDFPQAVQMGNLFAGLYINAPIDDRYVHIRPYKEMLEMVQRGK